MVVVVDSAGGKHGDCGIDDKKTKEFLCSRMHHYSTLAVML